MSVYSNKISFKTRGNCEIINITDKLKSILAKSRIKNGLINVFVPGATGAITTIEYEPGVVSDFQALLKEIVREDCEYNHNKTHSDGNATSHLRASLLGPSLSVPVDNGDMVLGVWQQVVFVEMDNRSRERSLVVKIIGE
ncbi:MAG: YjbQ family protein [Elusimicrobia bacterium]|nr:YjbQ family protein [Elusimicrobiota bacterium]